MNTSSFEARRPVEPPVSADALINDAMTLLATAVGSLRGDSTRDNEQSPALGTPGGALLRLVTGAGDTDPVSLGVPVTGSRLAVVSAESASVLSALRQRVELPRRVLEATTATGVWLLLVPDLPRPARDDVAARDTARVLAALQRTGVSGWHAGVSASLRDATELPAAFRDARDLAALAAHERLPALTVDEAWARLAVARLRNSARSALPTASPLDVLARYDRENDTSLGETLATWLDATCDTQTTARALCIHVNTLRYRLRRAATVAGLDLQDPHHRLVLQLTRSASR